MDHVDYLKLIVDNWTFIYLLMCQPFWHSSHVHVLELMAMNHRGLVIRFYTIINMLSFTKVMPRAHYFVPLHMCSTCAYMYVKKLAMKGDVI
jgi:hypothetical protein